MGSYLSTPPKTESKIPGRVAIVTGATRGIGLATAKQLYELGATVYLGCRTEEGANKAIAQIRADVTGSEGRLEWLPLDMSTIKKAKEAAEEFLRRENQLDILSTRILLVPDRELTFRSWKVHNAAIGDKTFEINDDGIEVTLGTNHFGPFVFTTTVLDLMKQTSAKPGSDVRIVSVASKTHEMLGSDSVHFADTDELKTTFPSTNPDSWLNRLLRYSRSKLANVLFVSELQHRLDAEGSNIIAISLHPGTVVTDGAIGSVTSLPVIGSVAGIIAQYVFADPAVGALNSMFAATNPVVRAEPDKYKGKYLMPVGIITTPSKPAQDQELAKRLWDLSEQVVQSRSTA
ncbi:hypothetical protein FRC12_015684 [Ceratobasidium sp. 428]|nr:hypothetical protein FRC12_015684 [Ceratobasidium sp. 428]